MSAATRAKSACLILLALSLSSLVLSHSGSARAQALDTPPAGAASLALAGAGVTRTGDPAAVWINPARLTCGRAGALAALELRSTSRSVGLQPAGVVNARAELARGAAGTLLSPSVAASLPLPWLRRTWIGVGYRMGPHLESRYPRAVTADDQPVVRPTRYLGTELEQIQHLFSLAIARNWTWLSLGASLELSHTRVAFERTLWIGGERDAADASYDLTARVAGTDTLRVGALLGASIDLRKWIPLELGLALRVPGTSSSVSAPLALTWGELPQGHLERAQGGEAKLALPGPPLRLQAGLALDFARFRLLLELAFERWSSGGSWCMALKESSVKLVDAAEETPLTELPLGIRLQDRVSAHAGLEVLLVRGLLTARAGYAYVRGATRGDQPSPVLIDLDHHVLGAGLHFEAKRWLALAVAVAHAFDATMQSGAEEGRRVTPLITAEQEPEGAGRYETSSTRVSLELQIGW
jgi:hypothetical protein